MIVLCMIVRNEAATIRRCLEAAKGSIDAWSIVDTGSTDNTREVIQEILRDIPGKLHERPWVNFGHNRTESFRLSKATAEELGARPGETWCLLLDADHQLGGRIVGADLSEPGYYLRQKDTGLEYSNTRLIRCDLDWRSVGVTHEYWSAPGVTVTATYHGAGIYDHADGGTRHEKFERDLRLLTQGLEDEPSNVRYMFYLAQTYEGMGRTSDAIAWYRKRAEAGGWAEEAWMARLRLAKLLDQTGQLLEAQTEYLRAFEERPSRAESLYHLARMWREVSANHKAYLFARASSEIPKPSDTLFVEHRVYSDLCQQEIGINSFYIGRKAEGFAALEKVLATPGADHNFALVNQSHYLEPIEALERGAYNIPEDFRTFDGVVYHCSNPSVAHDGTVNVRLVNYDQTNGKHYAGRPEPGVIKTRNALIRNDGDDLYLLDESILEFWNHDTKIFGLEDIRLSPSPNGPDWYTFTATCCQAAGKGGRPQVVIGHIVFDPHPRVASVYPIKYDKARDVEKNWILWSPEDRGSKIIYSFDPFVVLGVDTRSGRTIEIIRKPVESYAGRFRGSTPPIYNGIAWTALVHDVAYGQDRNVYSHRWVTFDEDGVIKYSEPFLLDHNGIEYAAGLKDNRDGTLTISYGYEDREARWVKVRAPW